jgi:hypothetical protein
MYILLYMHVSLHELALSCPHTYARICISLSLHTQPSLIHSCMVLFHLPICTLSLYICIHNNLPLFIYTHASYTSYTLHAVLIHMHMLQPLLSGPERFALGGGALWTFFCIISELCVACSITTLFGSGMHVDGAYICRWSTAVWNLQPCLHV